MNIIKLVLALVIFMSYINEVSANEKDLYDFLWLDPDKSVYVLQNKVYRKEKSFYVDLGVMRNSSSKFQSTKGGKVQTGYYFTETWAIEGFYSAYSNTENEDLKNVKAINGSEPFIRRPISEYGLLGIWSPFYGKINTFNKIFYFDWSFGLGLGQINTESNMNSVANPSSESSFTNENNTSFLAKTAFKFHFNERYHVGIEYKSTNYKAAGPRDVNLKKWRQSSDTIFTFGISF